MGVEMKTLPERRIRVPPISLEDRFRTWFILWGSEPAPRIEDRGFRSNSLWKGVLKLRLGFLEFPISSEAETEPETFLNLYCGRASYCPSPKFILFGIREGGTREDDDVPVRVPDWQIGIATVVCLQNDVELIVLGGE